MIGGFQRSDKRDVDDAVSAAKQAFERWRLVPAPRRAEIIYRAGEILLGPHTPFTLGNFVIGPNAVLPTSGAARTVSPLSVLDYVKRSSIAYVTAAGYPLLAPQAEALARYEGFDGHANAVSDWRWQGKAGKMC